MSKKIIITGKNNIDNLTVEKKKRVRINALENTICHERQIELIQNIVDEKDDNLKTKCISELERKINSYKQQDIKRNFFNELSLIKLNEVVKKLHNSSLTCEYCDKHVKVIYRIVRDPLQWTLDRIDNDKCHSNENTIIACLCCNLKRRRMDKEKFEFTKKLKIIKK